MQENSVVAKCNDIRTRIITGLKKYFGEDKVTVNSVDDPTRNKVIYEVKAKFDPVDKSLTTPKSLVTEVIRSISPMTLIGDRMINKVQYTRSKKMIFKLSQGGSLQLYLVEDDYLQHLWANMIVEQSPHLKEIMDLELRFQSIYSEEIHKSQKESVRRFKSELQNKVVIQES